MSQDLNLDPLQVETRMRKMQDRQEVRFKRELQRFFKSQKLAVIEALSRKDSSDITSLEKIILAVVTQSENEFEPINTDLIKGILLQGGSIGAELLHREFDGTDPEVILFLERYIPKFVREMGETTRQDLQTVMVAAQIEGWSIIKIKDELWHVFNEYNDHRAETIARSETIRASVIGIDQSFSKIRDMFRVADQDGKEQSIKVTYENVDHAPLHPSCRCTILPVF